MRDRDTTKTDSWVKSRAYCARLSIIVTSIRVARLPPLNFNWEYGFVNVAARNRSSRPPPPALSDALSAKAQGGGRVRRRIIHVTRHSNPFNPFLYKVTQNAQGEGATIKAMVVGNPVCTYSLFLVNFEVFIFTPRGGGNQVYTLKY